MNLFREYTKPALDSIRTKHLYRVVLIDNASTDVTHVESRRLMLSDYKFFNMRYERNMGCAASWNIGIKECFSNGCDYVFVTNNDVLLNKDTIDRLVERFEKGKDDPNLVMVTGMDISGECEKPTDIFTKDSKDKESVSESGHPNFSAFMVNKNTLDRVGEFDEGIFPAYYEDNEFHYRINLTNCKAITYPPAIFYHFGSRTQNQDLNPITAIIKSQKYERNKAYMFDKWGSISAHEIKYHNPFDDDRKSLKWTLQDAHIGKCQCKVQCSDLVKKYKR
jgi:GT2 family glycosyltransferase